MGGRALFQSLGARIEKRLSSTLEEWGREKVVKKVWEIGRGGQLRRIRRLKRLQVRFPPTTSKV